MLTTLVLGTTAYSSNGTAYSGFAGTTRSWAYARIFGLKLGLDDEAYSSLEFTALGCGPAIPFPPGLPVKLVVSNNDGSSPRTVFAGDLQRPQMQPSTQGPAWGYSATDLKKRADRVTLLSTSGLPVASYNLSPTDPLYLFNQSGKTVGQIVADVLQGLANATALSGLGVGNYATLSPPTLPAQTLADLAALQVVPPVPVQLQGEGILNRIESFLQSWQAQYVLYVQADGTIRVVSIFGRTATTLTQPSGSVAGDPIDDLTYTIDVSDCYTAVQVIGQDIAGTTLSFADGTLVRSTTSADLAAWTLAAWNTPQNANDDGTCTVTSSSATVHSRHSKMTWGANYWNNNGGVVVLYYIPGNGIAITETRQITSCTAMTAGGSATITWDSSLPLDSTGYTTYRLYATNTELNLVDRAFTVAEPSTGHTGLNTWVGSHMVPEFPYGYAWGNLGKGASQVSVIKYPAAKVLWSPTGQWPWLELPVGVDLDPSTGRVILKQPAVVLSAGLAGQVDALSRGYPTTTFAGKFADVQVAVPYNRGDLNVRQPASGFGGTAYSKYGVQRVKVIGLSSFVYRGDSPALGQLAAQHLAVVQDAVVEGSVRLHWDAWTPTFDVFSQGLALSIATPGAASDIDGLVLPVRSQSIEWPDSGPDIHLVNLKFNNRHRQFEGDDLYIHPSFSPDGWGAQQGTIFVAGNVGGFSGSADAEQFGASMSSGPDSSEGEMDFGGMEGGGGDMGGEATPMGAQESLGEDWGLGRSGRTASGESKRHAAGRADPQAQARKQAKAEKQAADEARVKANAEARKPKRKTFDNPNDAMLDRSMRMSPDKSGNREVGPDDGMASQIDVTGDDGPSIASIPTDDDTQDGG